MDTIQAHWDDEWGAVSAYVYMNTNFYGNWYESFKTIPDYIAVYGYSGNSVAIFRGTDLFVSPYDINK